MITVNVSNAALPFSMPSKEAELPIALPDRFGQPSLRPKQNTGKLILTISNFIDK